MAYVGELAKNASGEIIEKVGNTVVTSLAVVP